MKSSKADRRLAKTYRCSVSTIQRWRRDGAPLTDPERMKTWLVARRTMPPGTVDALRHAKPGQTVRAALTAAQTMKEAPRAKSVGRPGNVDNVNIARGGGNRSAYLAARIKRDRPDIAKRVEDGVEGAAECARRAEGLELVAYRDLLAAIESRDPARIATARKTWAGFATEVRRFNESIPAERRLGEQVPVDLAKDVLRSIAWWLRVTMREALMHAVPPEAMKQSLAAVDSYLLTLATTVSGWGLQQKTGTRGPIPAWASAALEDQLRNQFPDASLGAQVEALKMIVAAVTAQQVQAQAR